MKTEKLQDNSRKIVERQICESLQFNTPPTPPNITYDKKKQLKFEKRF